MNPAEWQNPEQGFLFGRVLEVEEKILILNAADQSIWEVDFAEAKIPPFLEIQVGAELRIIGEKTGRDQFAAEFVKPKVRGPKRMMKENLRGPRNR